MIMGFLHFIFILFFFLGHCRTFSPPWTFQPCCSAEEWHFQDKAAPCPHQLKLPNWEHVFAVLSQT